VVNLAFIASLPIGNVNKVEVCKMGKKKLNHDGSGDEE
jgi:hypothetical protein